MRIGHHLSNLSGEPLASARPGAVCGRVTAAVMACLCVFLGGCETPYNAFVPMPMSPEGVSVAAGQPSYGTNYIQEGDVVNITFQYSTNFNTTQMVGLDGSLNLQAAGQVKAAGTTSLQLQSKLAALYKSEVKDDPITVKVVSPAAAVYVMGAVIHPGRISMVRPMTVIEAIMEADGFDPSRAKLSEVKVLRVENGRQQVYRLNLQRIFDGKNDAVFYLKPFDVVQVPAKVFNY